MSRPDYERLAAQAAATTDVAVRLAAAELLAEADEVVHVELAQALALEAMAKVRPARAIAARAFDRLRVLAGKPQKFGTQSHVHDGVRVLYPVDPATTDSERAKWDVPSLAELQQRLAEERS
jgi:hypothetical protein